MKISNSDLQRVYMQAVRHKVIRVPGGVLAALLLEVAKARGVHLNTRETPPDFSITKFLESFDKGKHWWNPWS